jgi:hypothetical protein
MAYFVELHKFSMPTFCKTIDIAKNISKENVANLGNGDEAAVLPQ